MATGKKNEGKLGGDCRLIFPSTYPNYQYLNWLVRNGLL